MMLIKFFTAIYFEVLVHSKDLCRVPVTTSSIWHVAISIKIWKLQCLQ